MSDIPQQNSDQELTPVQVISALDIANVGAWFWCLEKDTVEFSTRLRELLELHPHQKPNLETLKSAVAPHDRPALDTAMEALILEKKPSPIEIIVSSGNVESRFLSVLLRTRKSIDGSAKELWGIVRDISHEQKTEKELLLRQTRLLRKSEELARVGHWSLDLRNNKLTWSDEVYRIYGLDKQNYDPDVETAILAYHPDDRKEVRRTLERSIQNGESFSFELRIIRPDGSIRYVTSIGESKLNKAGESASVFGIFQDITDRKRISHELETKEERYRNLFNQSTDGILIATPESRILEVNQRICSLFEYDMQEMVGQSISILHPESERPSIEKTLTSLSSDNLVDIEATCLTKSGATFLAKITPSIIEVGGKTYIQGLFRDITESRKAEIELRQAKEQAEESDRLKSAFLANMSHEIRTPLNGILGFSQLLKIDKRSPEDTAKYIDNILNNGRHLLSLIEDIIDIAQIESGQLKANPSQFDLNEMMFETFAFFERAIKQRHGNNVALVLENDVALSKRLISDGTRIRQILYNLINNAIKFTNDGSIHFGYVEKDSNIIEFFVIDTGIGIGIKNQKTIFERFQQVDDSLTRSHDGAGLGLTISRGLVDLLGGSISLKSKPGEGSEFRFTIQYESVIPQSDRPVSHPYSHHTVSKLPTGKILVVDDETVNFKLIGGILGESAIRLIHAKSGIEAIEIVENDKEIDLVLMDIRMPGIDGYETSRRLKEIAPNLPIIAQTAYAMAEDRTKAARSGCDDFLAKPLVSEDLAKVLDLHLRPETRR